MNKQTVFLGSLLALQQAGLLLEDAVILFDRGRTATAAALALLAREEIGRHRILQNVWREMTPDAVVPAKAINKRCEDHGSKQAAAQISHPLRADTESELGLLLKSQMRNAPGSQAFEESRCRLDDIRARQEKRAPKDRTQRREARLYVDAMNEREWSVPSSVDPATSAYDLDDAILEYLTALTCLGPGFSPDLQEGFSALAQRPTLPKPPQPAWKAWVDATKKRAGAQA